LAPRLAGATATTVSLGAAGAAAGSAGITAGAGAAGEAEALLAVACVFAADATAADAGRGAAVLLVPLAEEDTEVVLMRAPRGVRAPVPGDADGVGLPAAVVAPAPVPRLADEGLAWPVAAAAGSSTAAEARASRSRLGVRVWRRRLIPASAMTTSDIDTT
jgi:hypothetical protein